jgi:hypothetical protein
VGVIHGNKHGGSAGVKGVFGGAAGFAGLGAAGFAELGTAGFAAEPGLFADSALPVVKCLRIFSSRFGPMPRMASKSSTLLNAPYDLRICKHLVGSSRPNRRHQLQLFRSRRILINRAAGRASS